MASSDVDSEENLGRWRALVGGSTRSTTGEPSAANPALPEVPNASLARSRPGDSDITVSAQAELPAGSINDVGTARTPLRELNDDSARLSRSRAASMNDDPFRIAVHNAMQASSGATSTPTASAPGTPVKFTTDAAFLSPHRKHSIDIPSTTHDSEPTPASTSPSPHPHPSPSISGLRAPSNSPQVHPSSPRFAPGNTHDEDVGAALAWYVQNLEGGRSLNDSIWAPTNSKQMSSPLRESRLPSSSVTPSRRSEQSNGLVPVDVVRPNPAINDSFSRMSFRAADSDRKVGDNIIGERNTRPTVTPENLVSQTILGSPGDSQRQNIPVPTPAAPAAPAVLGAQPSEPAVPAQTITSGMGKDNIVATDLDKEKENISSTSPSEIKTFPPHLRRNQEMLQTSQDSLTGPSDEVTKPLRKDLNTTAERSDGVPQKPPQASPQQKPVPVSSVLAPDKAASPAADAEDTEDRQNQIYFTSWGKLEERKRPSARVRSVTITDLPFNATPSFVASLVYGGNLDVIQTRSSASGRITASVVFMDADACKRYLDDTLNGIDYKPTPQSETLVSFVYPGQDVMPVGGMLQQWIDKGVTRCVRAVGVGEEWTPTALKNLAEGKGRKLEGISSSINPAGARSVVFRFCKVEHAVHFSSALVRNEDWEHCNVHFVADPCATATGVHFTG